jgi:lipopolysaccharide transport system permease protein
MSNATDEKWDFEISAKNSLFDLKLKELWHYRDLLILLVRRDFVSFYKQTILGPIWFFVQPIVTIVFYTVVFGGLAGIPVDGLPKALFTWQAPSYGITFLIALSKHQPYLKTMPPCWARYISPG